MSIHHARGGMLPMRRVCLARSYARRRSVGAILGYLASLPILSLVACAPSLSSLTIVPPPDTAPEQVSHDYAECRQQAQELSMTYVPAGAMLAAMSRVGTNDGRFLECLETKSYSVETTRRRSPSTQPMTVIRPRLVDPVMQKTAFDAVLEGKLCRALPTQSIECRYTVGNDLQFAIARIRETDAGLSLIRSDRRGDFYADVEVFPGCIRVTKRVSSAVRASPGDRGGTTDVAFVSIRTGAVYRYAEGCPKDP